MNQLLDYLATYFDNGTTYRASDMILCAHAFTMNQRATVKPVPTSLSPKNNPFLKHNHPILSISQMMKFVMSSAAKAELSALYTTSKEMVPLCQTLIETGWLQPCMPIQTDNSTAIVITNLIIILQNTKSMDLRLWWLCCQESQQQFRYYWDKGNQNWADYHTKHNPPIYHKANRPIHAGAAGLLP
jgi:hypothetical protein